MVVYHYNQRTSYFRLKIELVLSWVTAIFCNSPQFFVREVFFLESLGEFRCINIWPTQNQEKIFLYIKSTFTYITPIMFGVVCYTQVWRIYQRSYRRVGDLGNAASTVSGRVDERTISRKKELDPARSDLGENQPQRLLLLLFLPVASLVILPTPRLVIQLLLHYSPTSGISESILLLVDSISHVQMITDPFFYGFMASNVRRGMCEMIRKMGTEVRSRVQNCHFNMNCKDMSDDDDADEKEDKRVEEVSRGMPDPPPRVAVFSNALEQGNGIRQLVLPPIAVNRATLECQVFVSVNSRSYLPTIPPHRQFKKRNIVRRLWELKQTEGFK